MASDWIPMRCNLPDDPTVIAASDSLGIDVDTVVGKLHRVWSWYDQHTRNGVAKNVTPARMNARVGCDNFLESFITDGWFSVTPEGLKMNKFHRWLSQSGKRRALNARRQANWRTRKRNANSNASPLPTEHNSTEHKSKKATPSKSKSPPTLEEVRAYFAEKQTAIDPEQFFAHYDANGWRQANGNPIKNWKSALVTWEKNERNRKGNHASRNSIPAGAGQRYDGKPLGKF